MTSHVACTSGTSRIITIASFQRLKMEALIPAPADCEVRSVIKFFNAKSIAPIEIHHELCQVYGLTRLDGQHISCRSSAGRCLINIHSITLTSRSVIFIFSYTSINSCWISVSVFKMRERRRWVSEWFQSQAADFCDTGYKRWSHGMTNISISEVNILKNSTTLGIWKRGLLYWTGTWTRAFSFSY